MLYVELNGLQMYMLHEDSISDLDQIGSSFKLIFALHNTFEKAFQVEFCLVSGWLQIRFC